MTKPQTLTRETLNALLDEVVFQEPRPEQLIKDLCTLIGGDACPATKLDDMMQAAYRVTLHIGC